MSGGFTAEQLGIAKPKKLLRMSDEWVEKTRAEIRRLLSGAQLKDVRIREMGKMPPDARERRM